MNQHKAVICKILTSNLVAYLDMIYINKFSLSHFSPLVMFPLQASKVQWLRHNNKEVLHPLHQAQEALHTKEHHPRVTEEPRPLEVPISTDHPAPRKP